MTEAHAMRLLTARKMDPSRANLRWAARRAAAAGRLAELGVHMVPGVLRVRTVEHGGPDAMTPGSMFAEIWLDARDQHEWTRRAVELLEREDYAAKKFELRLTLAIYRATWWDRVLRKRA